MPYIQESQRKPLDEHILELTLKIDTPGELAYVVFRLMRAYWFVQPSFSRWAQLRGAVEDQIDEFRTRFIEPYEQQKQDENGDAR